MLDVLAALATGALWGLVTVFIVGVLAMFIGVLLILMGDSPAPEEDYELHKRL